ncbi:hypothetical protein XENOCAPTIV_027816, partial [Xenoophorus captivus]
LGQSNLNVSGCSVAHCPRPPCASQWPGVDHKHQDDDARAAERDDLGGLLPARPPVYPLLRLPLPGTGPVEFTTGLRDYSIPSHEPQGDVERPDWVTDLFPGLRRMQSVLPEHGCLLVSPGNYWQNQRDLFDSDSDLLKTIQKHEPKGLHTSATLRGRHYE